MWEPITDTNSNIIAEIYANGNDLDTVRTSFYRNSGPVREDGGYRLYLDRNITITPETQPLSDVRIRLYIANAEFNSLSSAVNSLSQPSGVSTINNLGIFKNSNNVCGSTITGGVASPLTTISKVAHGTSGYVLQSNTLSSFSTFFFANSSLTTLPVQLISFTGYINQNTTLLDWTTSSEINAADFVIERSENGNDYSAIGTVAATGNSNSAVSYSYTDNDVAALSASVIYYRLKIVDRDGNYAYSNVITVSLADIAGNVTMSAIVDGKAQWKITDNAGRTVLQSSTQLKKGRNNVVININKFSAGIYYLSVSGAGIDQNIKLQKL
jgi:hypothetical protein